MFWIHGQSAGPIYFFKWEHCTFQHVNGYAIVTDASSEAWGGWAMFKDSEGNVLGLHSPVPAGVSAN